MLHGINSASTHKKITLGSLVNTDKGWLYISIPLGKVKIEGFEMMVISLASPIGQALQNKTESESLSFNGMKWDVINVL